jgi:hypothetical protein
LYYADTARNKAAGKTPGTVVKLPIIDGFKPNDNRNSQTSDVLGAYGFMVFPEADYYIVATKDGYKEYKSQTISVENELIKHDIQMTLKVPVEAKVDTTTVNPSALVKTGSFVDEHILIILGMSFLLAGLFLVRKKERKI